MPLSRCRQSTPGWVEVGLFLVDVMGEVALGLGERTDERRLTNEFGQPR
jgi:hypothetical protein